MLQLDCVVLNVLVPELFFRLMGCELTPVLSQVLNGLQTLMVWQLSTAGTETGEFGPETNLHTCSKTSSVTVSFPICHPDVKGLFGHKNYF